MEATGFGESTVRTYERDVRPLRRSSAMPLGIIPDALYEIDSNNA